MLSTLEEAKLPAGPVYSPQQALDDAHVQALGFLKQADYPVSLSATPGTIRGAAPRLGEYTDEILLELGYDDGDIRRTRDVRVVWPRRAGLRDLMRTESPHVRRQGAMNTAEEQRC